MRGWRTGEVEKCCPRLSESPVGWVKINQFFDVLGFPAGQAKRDHIVGGTAWRIGDKKRRYLAEDRDWVHRPGSRGGGAGAGKGPLHVRLIVLEEIFFKYYTYKSIA